MAEPQLVAECIAAMNSRVKIPVTVKCRIGIDDMDDYAGLEHFVDTVAAAGCEHFIVHARKAWLQGLSPKQNREIPPLRYDDVYRLKASHPSMTITINGGIRTSEEIALHLQQVDGVMLGREAYHNPYLLAEIDRVYYASDEPVASRERIISELLPYIEDELAQGTRLHSITRHILGLFAACPGARGWRRELSTSAHLENADSTVIVRALHNNILAVHPA
jgi:tRNA-dihydrouridine synthase A